MKLLYLMILLSVGTQSNAQNLKTVFVNDTDVVALFFPNTIRQALTGSKNFMFSYNRESAQHVGVIQGLQGKQSSLLVITDNGQVYSYRLAYKKALDTLNYFISADDTIGNEAPVTDESNNGAPMQLDTSRMISTNFQDSLLYRREYFEKFSLFNLKKNKNSLKKKRKGGIVLHLRDLVYDRTEVYAIIEIKNKSEIDFEVDYLKTFKINGNNRRKASYQKIPFDHLHNEGFPEIIEVGESSSFVVVIPKFVLGDSERLLLELKETRGNRILQLIY